MRDLFVILAMGALLSTAALAPVHAAPKSTGQAVSIDELPAPAKATIEREAKGGSVARVTQETDKGKTYYEVEIQKDGKDRYVDVAPEGIILRRESAKKEVKEETKK